MSLRRLVHRCYGDAFPEAPGGCFPASVLDPGAFPVVPYDLAYWGFPCNEYSGLQRESTPASMEESLATFEQALERFRVNLPWVFILENTAALLNKPLVLSRIATALRTLPYTWRWPPAPLISGGRPCVSLWQPGHPSPSVPPRCSLICPHADFQADIHRPRLWLVGYLD